MSPLRTASDPAATNDAPPAGGQKTAAHITFPIEMDRFGLERAADAYFPYGKGVGTNEFNALAGKFYSTLNLSHRADIWGDTDRDLLDIAINVSTWWLHQGTTRYVPRTKRMIVIGCGNGRLAKEYILSAQKANMTELVFNDLFDFHIEATRSTVESLDIDLDGLQISYHVGDFGAAGFSTLFDIAIALFFVTSEVLELESAQSLRKCRTRFFQNVRRCLHPNGVFIEDVPEPNLPGFYSQLRALSAAIMTEKGLMREERGNITFTNLAKSAGGYPYHVRYIPSIERHIEELRAVGFNTVASWNACANPEAGKGLDQNRRIKRIEIWSAGR